MTLCIDPHPIGDVKTIADIQRKLRERIDEKKLEPGRWVFGWGYDDTGVKEQRHPNRDDLDAVSTEHPIVLMHISSHLMTCNSKAVEINGVTAETADPDGGKIQRQEGSKKPNGVMEEKAMGLLLAKVPGMKPDQALEMLEKRLKKYAEAGITTAQEGAGLPPMIKLLEAADQAGILPIDVVSYPAYLTVDDATIAKIAETWKTPARYRMGGIKLALDGSIQGYTANLSKPYHIQPGGKQALQDCTCASDTGLRLVLGSEAKKEAEQDHEHTPGNDYRGYANMTVEEIVSFLRKADDAGIPVIAHCNGDASVDDLIEAVRKVRGDRSATGSTHRDYPRPDHSRRPTELRGKQRARSLIFSDPCNLLGRPAP